MPARAGAVDAALEDAFILWASHSLEHWSESVTIRYRRQSRQLQTGTLPLITLFEFIRWPCCCCSLSRGKW